MWRLARLGGGSRPRPLRLPYRPEAGHHIPHASSGIIRVRVHFFVSHFARLEYHLRGKGLSPSHHRSLPSLLSPFLPLPPLTGLPFLITPAPFFSLFSSHPLSSSPFTSFPAPSLSLFRLPFPSTRVQLCSQMQARNVTIPTPVIFSVFSGVFPDRQFPKCIKTRVESHKIALHVKRPK